MAIHYREVYKNGEVIAVEEVQYDDQSILKIRAQQALDKSDVVVIRNAEHGLRLPTEWINYRESLRSIVKTGLGSLPSVPDYP